MGCFLKFFSLYLWYDRNYIITGISLHIIFLCGIPIRKEGREMGSQSKRMMNAKQDQYREYVIEKLLAETTIGKGGKYKYFHSLSQGLTVMPLPSRSFYNCNQSFPIYLCITTKLY